MTKAVLGTLTFMALMSVVLAKLFSQLAFADEIPFNPAHLAQGAQYRVEQVYAPDAKSVLIPDSR